MVIVVEKNVCVSWSVGVVAFRSGGRSTVTGNKYKYLSSPREKVTSCCRNG